MKSRRPFKRSRNRSHDNRRPRKNIVFISGVFKKPKQYPNASENFANKFFITSLPKTVNPARVASSPRSRAFRRHLWFFFFFFIPFRVCDSVRFPLYLLIVDIQCFTRRAFVVGDYNNNYINENLRAVSTQTRVPGADFRRLAFLPCTLRFATRTRSFSHVKFVVRSLDAAVSYKYVFKNENSLAERYGKCRRRETNTCGSLFMFSFEKLLIVISK